MLAEDLLDTVHPTCGAEAFDCSDVPAIQLHGQHEAGADADPVKGYGAGTANPVLAPDMGAGQTHLIPKEVGGQQAGFDIGLARFAVYG